MPLGLGAREAWSMRAAARAARRCGNRRRAARPRRRGTLRTTWDRSAPGPRARPLRAPCSPSRRGADCGSCPPATRSTPCGIRRTSSRCGTSCTGPGRRAPRARAAIGSPRGAVRRERTSSNAIFAGSVGTVPTPWHFAHERSLWQLEQRSRSLPARTPCSRIQSPSWTRWPAGGVSSAARLTWHESQLREFH